jgi:cell wall-associated NlpC family hydrolase
MSIVRRAALLGGLSSVLALVAVAAVAAMPGARAWAADSPGGISTFTPEPETNTPAAEATAPRGKAIIVAGRAIPPLNAPPAVKKVIAAANKIRAKPYIWGGGHARWWDAGYDCSGAVSYALHGAGLLDYTMVSGQLAHWGDSGPGRWITIYANAEHVFMVVGGLRYDTRNDPEGVTGPRWKMAAPEASILPRFAVRHPAGL